MWTNSKHIDKKLKGTKYQDIEYNLITFPA